MCGGSVTALEQRRDELSKITQLDGKIASELQQLRQRMDQMQAESKQFQGADQMRQQSESTKQQLAAERSSLKQQREAIRGELQAALRQSEAAKQVRRLGHCPLDVSSVWLVTNGGMSLAVSGSDSRQGCPDAS